MKQYKRILFNDSYEIPDDDSVLLTQCKIFTSRAHGKGGQHINKTDSAVTIHHLPTGIIIYSRRERSQYRNKMLGVKRLRIKLCMLMKKETVRIPTSMPQSVKQKRKDVKRRHSEKKMQRRINLFE